MKLEMTRWKLEPSKPKPFSPVHSARKFSTVFGTSSPYRPITMRPSFWPSASTSKNTLLVTVGPAVASANKAAKIVRRSFMVGCYEVVLRRN